MVFVSHSHKKKSFKRRSAKMRCLLHVSTTIQRINIQRRYHSKFIFPKVFNCPAARIQDIANAPTRIPSSLIIQLYSACYQTLLLVIALSAIWSSAATTICQRPGQGSHRITNSHSLSRSGSPRGWMQDRQHPCLKIRLLVPSTGCKQPHLYFGEGALWSG